MSRVVVGLLALLAVACKEPAKQRVVPAASASTAAAAVASALPSTPPSNDEVCRRYASTPVPEADSPSDAQAAAVRGCDADRPYYGVGGSVDDLRARHCALSHEPPDADVLAMLYANGRGVVQSFDLALRFVCEVGGEPAELSARIQTLWRAKQLGQLSRPFEICDDVQSIDLHCNALQSLKQEAERLRRFRALESKLPHAELHALQHAAELYIETRARLEVDLSGIDRAAFSYREENALYEQLVTTLEQLSRVPRVEGDPIVLLRDVRSLAGRLRGCKSLAQLEGLVPGTVTRAGISQTQAAWATYQSRFAALLRKAVPEADAQAWLAWLAAERLKQLKELAGDCEPAATIGNH